MDPRQLLRPLSPLYRALVTARRAAYDRGLLPSRRLDVPVISVGNLTFGGTGKTPTTVALVRDLAHRGHRPAVLTRGYGRSLADPLVLLGPDAETSPSVAGDEPLELANKLPGVPIVVDADRVRGGATAIAAGADLVVLDDGFQHRRLGRDLDLVLIDAGDPWGGDRLPPAGRLREPVEGLARASAVIVTKLAPNNSANLAPVTRRVAALAPGIPVVPTTLRITRVRHDGAWHEPTELARRPLLAFAGIGRPAAFTELLASAGAEVVETRWFADHHRYSAGEVAELVAAAEALGLAAVTTAKDAVKLPADSPVWVVEVAVVPLAGTWDELWALLPGETP